MTTEEIKSRLFKIEGELTGWAAWQEALAKSPNALDSERQAGRARAQAYRIVSRMLSDFQEEISVSRTHAHTDTPPDTQEVVR